MREGQILHEKLNRLLESVKVLSDNINSAVSYHDERLIAIERLMWKIERKLIDQEKVLDLLSENKLIDKLVTMKYYQDKINPIHLQSKEYQSESVKTTIDDSDENE
ncbi:hypothetical protein [Paenibacillus sp. AR247]|uniref:hypothetical protein n=1 Tax=Paenibacillus sp. AR247 TaxID=1631599 RepID=UPI000CF8E6E6|nr:hypothetical protein [Paenibacillus sp. AR247]PQP90943.1 hypothetical protein CPT76_03765 [Paenibacillus sp. AR247]